MADEKWEDVASPYAGDYTERLRVPGGWLYRSWLTSPEGGIKAAVMALVFVPMPSGRGSDMEVDLNPPEVADRRVYLRLPPDLYEDIRVTAKQAGVPVNWWIIQTLDAMFGFTNRKPRPRQLG